MKDEIYTEKKHKNIEDMIAETEQKIINKEYYYDVEIEYKEVIVDARIRPLSQSRLVQITKNKKDLESAEGATRILGLCLINKDTNELYEVRQIQEYLEGGLALAVAMKCLEVSGISLDDELKEEMGF